MKPAAASKPTIFWVRSIELARSITRGRRLVLCLWSVAASLRPIDRSTDCWQIDPLVVGCGRCFGCLVSSQPCRVVPRLGPPHTRRATGAPHLQRASEGEEIWPEAASPKAAAVLFKACVVPVIKAATPLGQPREPLLANATDASGRRVLCVPCALACPLAAPERPATGDRVNINTTARAVARVFSGGRGRLPKAERSVEAQAALAAFEQRTLPRTAARL
jgi:hypothetical protein